MLRSVDVYCAPNTGQESFGVILLEAMAARTPIVASDIEAFRRVLGGGTAGRAVRDRRRRRRWPPRSPRVLDDTAAARAARRAPASARSPRTTGGDRGPRCCASTNWRSPGARVDCRVRARPGSAPPRVGAVLPVGWLVVAVVVAVLLTMWITFTLTRLDRLHARVDAAQAALDAQLVRRAAALLHVAESRTAGSPGPAARRCEPDRPGRAGRHGRRRRPAGGGERRRPGGRRARRRRRAAAARWPRQNCSEAAARVQSPGVSTMMRSATPGRCGRGACPGCCGWPGGAACPSSSTSTTPCPRPVRHRARRPARARPPSSPTPHDTDERIDMTSRTACCASACGVAWPLSPCWQRRACGGDSKPKNDAADPGAVEPSSAPTTTPAPSTPRAEPAGSNPLTGLGAGRRSAGHRGQDRRHRHRAPAGRTSTRPTSSTSRRSRAA